MKPTAIREKSDKHLVPQTMGTYVTGPDFKASKCIVSPKKEEIMIFVGCRTPTFSEKQAGHLERHHWFQVVIFESQHGLKGDFTSNELSGRVHNIRHQPSALFDFTVSIKGTQDELRCRMRRNVTRGWWNGSFTESNGHKGQIRGIGVSIDSKFIDFGK